jgi:hypothetical protein
MSVQYVNQSINQSHYLDHFPICQEANGVSTESTCAHAQHETLDCRKLHKRLSNSCHRNDHHNLEIVAVELETKNSKCLSNSV